MAAHWKQVRLKDDNVLEVLRQSNCEVCGASSPSDPCHFISKGAGGPDEIQNVFAACRACHSFQHTVGIVTFWERLGHRIQASRRFKGWPLIDDEHIRLKLERIRKFKGKDQLRVLPIDK